MKLKGQIKEILLQNLSKNVGLYICCRPLVGRLFFLPHIIQVFPSDRWQECIGLYFYGPVPFRMRVFHSGKLPVFLVILCLISVVVGGGGGVSGQW